MPVPDALLEQVIGNPIRQRVFTADLKNLRYFKPIAQEGHQGPATAGEEKKTSVTDQSSEQVSPRVLIFF